MASAHGFAERFKDALEHGPTMRARSVGKITVHVLEGGQPAIDLRESLEKSPEKLAAYFKSNS